MEKTDNARKLLDEKVRNVRFEDEVYTLVHDMVSALAGDVETELGPVGDEDDDERWYDSVRDDMMAVLYERIGEWLTAKTDTAMGELLEKIFPDGYTCKTLGNWKGYVGFHGEDAITLQVYGNWAMRLGLEVFTNLGSCSRPVLDDVNKAIMDSGLVHEPDDMPYTKTVRYRFK